MAGMKRTLNLFFERELRHLRRAASFFKFSRPDPRERVFLPGQTRRTILSKATGFPRRLRTSVGHTWTTGASFFFSLLLHALVFGALASWWIPQLGTESEKNAGVTFAVWLQAPTSDAGSSLKEASTVPVKQLEAPADPPRTEVDFLPAPLPDGVVSETKDAADSDPARGLPVEQSTSLTDLAPPPLPDSIGLGSGSPPFPVFGNGVVRGFSTRGEGKGEALRRYGGGGATESAVGGGLRWLAEHQDADGGWSADGFQKHCRHFVPCSGNGLSEFDVGVTALATLAFLGSGHCPETPDSESDFRSKRAVGPGAVDGSPYRRNVRKALDYLLNHQDGEGAFGAIGDNYLYNHALATFAMAEACSMTGSRRYRGSLEAAVAFDVSSQQPGGGWDYTAKSSGRNDLSITGWQIMALRSAANAGIPVPEVVLQRIGHFLDIAIKPDGQGVYANLGQEAGRLGINMVSVGLLSMIYMGALPEEARVRKAVDRLLHEPPDWEATSKWETRFQSYYYWYTATLGLFHLGGEQWKAWNFFLLRSLLPLQSKKPHELGSWPHERNWVGVSGGRVYATAMCVLTLETYYRYESIFKTKKS